MLEKKFPNTYKLKLLENLRIHPIFHVSFLKPISRDASMLNREQQLKAPTQLHS